jgi:hypothetical protein
MTNQDRLAELEAELRRLPQPEPPAALEAALISAIPAVIPLQRSGRRSRWTSLAALAAAAVAACVPIALAVWATSGAERAVRSNSHAPGTQALAPATPYGNLPQASCALYYRAWLKSPDAFDKMLTHDNAVLLRPEHNSFSLTGRTLFPTLNLFEEKNHEKHSIRNGVLGALV